MILPLRMKRPISIVIPHMFPINNASTQEILVTSTGSPTSPTIRQRARRPVDHSILKVVMTLIVINAITLGFKQSATIMGHIGPVLLMFDKIVMAIFCVEIVLRIYAHGPAFSRPWESSTSSSLRLP